jgi:hypothetical protein
MINNHLVFGQALHDGLEYLLINGYDEKYADEAYDKFLLSYRKEIPEHLDSMFEPKTPAAARKALHAYCKKYHEDRERYKIIYTEIAGKISLDDQYHIFFRMDSIVKNVETEEFGSLEHKTGTRLNKQWREKWELSLQAGIYTHVLRQAFEDVFGIIFNGIFFNKVKDPARQLDFGRVKVIRTNNQMLSWWHNIRYWMEQLDNEYLLLSLSKISDQALVAFPMNVTACDKYFGCRYRDLCSAWPNPLRYCNEPPPGFEVKFWDPTEREAKHSMEIGGKRDES